MAHLLRGLVLLMVIGIVFTMLLAFGIIQSPWGHIAIAVPAFIFVIFVQAFVMFYFIGSARLVQNVYNVLHSENNLSELFEVPPKDLTPYKKKVGHMVHQSTVCKRQTIPWSMLMIVLGMLAFLLGGAHDTGLVSKTTHVGVVYGFSVAMLIGFFRQWVYLRKTHILLREIKALFEIPDASM